MPLRLLIHQCPDALMWYADKVGQLVPYLGKWQEGYHSRDDGGYANLVKFEDARLIDDSLLDAYEQIETYEREHG